MDPEILMNQDVAQPDDIAPRHGTVVRGKFLAQPCDGFAYYRELLGNSVT